MDILEWDETFGGVKLRLELEVEDLHPIGYKYIKGRQYIVLLGGREYVFKGTAYIHAPRKTGFDVSYVHMEVEGNLEMTGEDEEQNVYRLAYKEDYPDCESTVYGIAEIPFQLKPIHVSTESYEGLDTSVSYNLCFSVFQSNSNALSLSVPFFVSVPMPIPSMPMSTTSVYSLYDQLRLAVHLDRTTFAVNDIITGWIQVLHAEHSFQSVQLRLKKIEQTFLRDEDGKNVTRKNVSLSEPYEIMDTIYPLCEESAMKSKPYKDVSLEAYEEWEEEEMILEESEVGKIPFSMFIREMGGVSPSVSRVVGKFSVDWQLEFVIRDSSRIEYVYDTDIDIVRGEIVSLFSNVCLAIFQHFTFITKADSSLTGKYCGRIG